MSSTRMMVAALAVSFVGSLGMAWLVGLRGEPSILLALGVTSVMAIFEAVRSLVERLP